MMSILALLKKQTKFLTHSANNQYFLCCVVTSKRSAYIKHYQGTYRKMTRVAELNLNDGVKKTSRSQLTPNQSARHWVGQPRLTGNSVRCYAGKSVLIRQPTGVNRRLNFAQQRSTVRSLALPCSMYQ